MKELPVLIPLLTDLFARAVQVLNDPEIHEKLTQPTGKTDVQLDSVLEVSRVLANPALREGAISMFAVEVLQNEPNMVEVLGSYAERRNALAPDPSKTPQMLFDLALNTVKQLQNTLQGPKHS